MPTTRSATSRAKEIERANAAKAAAEIIAGEQVESALAAGSVRITPDDAATQPSREASVSGHGDDVVDGGDGVCGEGSGEEESDKPKGDVEQIHWNFIFSKLEEGGERGVPVRDQKVRRRAWRKGLCRGVHGEGDSAATTAPV